MSCSSFEDKKVLDGVSLKVEPHDRLVIMGQSGSGKSTILRLILGILHPTAAKFSSNNLKSPDCNGASCNKCARTSEWFTNIPRCSAPGMFAITSPCRWKN